MNQHTCRRLTPRTSRTRAEAFRFTLRVTFFELIYLRIAISGIVSASSCCSQQLLQSRAPVMERFHSRASDMSSAPYFTFRL